MFLFYQITNDQFECLEIKIWNASLFNHLFYLSIRFRSVDCHDAKQDAANETTIIHAIGDGWIEWLESGSIQSAEHRWVQCFHLTHLGCSLFIVTMLGNWNETNGTEIWRKATAKFIVIVQITQFVKCHLCARVHTHSLCGNSSPRRRLTLARRLKFRYFFFHFSFHFEDFVTASAQLIDFNYIMLVRPRLHFDKCISCSLTMMPILFIV